MPRDAASHALLASHALRPESLAILRVRPRALVVLARGLRCRCPACGTGRLFRRGVESEAVCAACGWRIERCPGHWVGGNEINVLVSFTTGVVVWIAAALAFGLGLASVVLATAATGVAGVGLYRPCRGVFYAIDYLLDPDPASNAGPPAPGNDDRPRDPRSDGPPPAPSPPPALRAAGPAPPPTGSSESFIPPRPAPYPPPSTVSP